MKLAHRFNQEVTEIKTNPIRAFDQEISQIPGIIKLTLGEPDFNTPDIVKEAAIQALHDNYTSYAPTPGYADLRKAAADFVKDNYQLDYDPQSEVAITVGSTEALSAAFKTVLNPGDKVIIPTPHFSLYDTMIHLNQAEPIFIDTSANGFVLDAQKVADVLAEEGDAVKAIVLNYPTNPTGVNWTRQEAKELAEVLAKYDIFVISDEVYSEILYNSTHVSMAEFLPEQTIVINAVSKSHAMTGWRMGMAFAPVYIMTELMKAHGACVTCADSIAQRAALAALTKGKEASRAMLKEYTERRQVIVAGLREAGFELETPRGAFYAFAKIPANLPQDSFEFGKLLAEKAKVGGVPGGAFGPAANNYIRFSYAASMEDLKEVVRRIKAFMADF